VPTTYTRSQEGSFREGTGRPDLGGGLGTGHPSECAAYPVIAARGLSRGLRCAVALVSIVVWSKVEAGAVDGEASIIVL
jgi:hypothetical protein